MRGSSLLLALALFAQSDDIANLQRERYAAQDVHTFMDMVSVQAVHEDGTPARGSISCEGLWTKYDERIVAEWNLPFVTDSRGVSIFNPWIGEYTDDVMTCSALDRHGHRGSASWPMPVSHAEIVVR